MTPLPCMTTPLDILIVDDNHVEYRLFAEAVDELSLPVVLRHVRAPSAVLEAIAARAPEVVLINHAGRHGGAAELLELVRRQGLRSPPVVAVLSGMARPPSTPLDQRIALWLEKPSDLEGYGALVERLRVQVRPQPA